MAQTFLPHSRMLTAGEEQCGAGTVGATDAGSAAAVLSTKCRLQSSRRAASARRHRRAKTRSQTPALCHREKRDDTVFQEP
jgi:hypothetical protein